MSAHPHTGMPHMRARASDPYTSHEAAAMASRMADDHASMVLDALQSATDPVGAEQIAESCGLAAYQVRKRLPELQRMGLADVTGDARKTKSGRSERLWHKCSPM